MHLPSPTDLLTFIEIAKTKSISETANRRGLTQPTVSYTLTKLEEQLGKKLCVRSSRFLNLTDEGEKLLEYALRILSEYENLKDSLVPDPTRVTGTFRIGCHPAAAHFVLAPVLQSFRKQMPGIEIILDLGLSRSLEERVLALDTHCAFVVNPKSYAPLVYKKILNDKVSVWQHKELTKKDLEKEQMLFGNFSLIQSQHILRNLRKKSIALPFRPVECDSLELVCSLVQENAGLGIVPSRIVTAMRTPSIQPIVGLPSYSDTFYFCFHAAQRNTPVLKDCLKFLYKEALKLNQNSAFF